MQESKSAITILEEKIIGLLNKLKGNHLDLVQLKEHSINPTTSFERNLIFFMGVGGLLFVPVFKMTFHLAPYIGMLISLGVLWVTTEIIHRGENGIYTINMIIGLLSSIIDNVPLVAGAMGMYDIGPVAEGVLAFPQDHTFWEFLAYCAGTGGSVLIIGSAAGVAVMGILKIDFIWYVKNISLLALMGYLAGAATYILMQ